MRFSSLLLTLGLLPFFPAAAAEPLGVKPGRVVLTVLPDSILPLDFASFDGLLCPGAGLLKGGGHHGQCGATVPNGSDRQGEADEIEGTIASQLETFTLDIVYQPTRLYLRSSEPWLASCGLFDFEVTLDPKAMQPLSRLVLAPAGRARGVFSLLLEAAVVVRFEAVADGKVVEVPTTVKLPVGGPYALTARTESHESNLALLVREESEGWAGAVSCSSPPRHCPDLCLTAPEKKLEALSTPR